MANGDFYKISGTMAWLPAGFTVFLDDCGGYWTLELGWRDFRRAGRWLGERVEVEGVAIDHNVLDVKAMRLKPLPEYEIVRVKGGCVEMRVIRDRPPPSPS